MSKKHKKREKAESVDFSFDEVDAEITIERDSKGLIVFKINDHAHNSDAQICTDMSRFHHSLNLVVSRFVDSIEDLNQGEQVILVIGRKNLTQGEDNA